jgi:catechol 2,3-dioxygenase-like lactoylglutathione lyase family enzyme
MQLDHVSLDHVSLVVSDLERSVAWWQRALGADPGGIGIELVQAPAASSAERVAANDTVGGLHVCLQVPDIEESYLRLLANDVTPSTPPRELIPGVQSLYFRDPDGIQLQLIQSGDRLGLHHVAFNVSDLETTLAWYRSTFGLAPTYRSTAAGAHISEMLQTASSSYSVALVPVGSVLLELMQWDEGPPPESAPTWHLALTGGRALSHHDPDGFLVQVLESQPAASSAQP